MPFIVLPAFFLFLTVIFPENNYLYVGVIIIWFFLCDIRNKIANESNSCDTKINTTIAKEIIKIRAEINNDLTAKINSRDANYATEAQNIITMINDAYEKYNEIKQVLETYHNNFNQIVNEFETIRRTITTLQDEINQRYSLIQSMSRRGSDQQSEISSSSIRSTNSTRSSNFTESGRIQYSNISSTIWACFKEVLDQERNARNLTFDEMCNRIEVCIQDLGGKIKTATIKNFYNNSTSCKSSTL